MGKITHPVQKYWLQTSKVTHVADTTIRTNIKRSHCERYLSRKTLLEAISFGSGFTRYHKNLTVNSQYWFKQIQKKKKLTIYLQGQKQKNYRGIVKKKWTKQKLHYRYRVIILNISIHNIVNVVFQKKFQ